MFRRLSTVLLCTLALVMPAGMAQAAPAKPVITTPRQMAEVVEGDVLHIRVRIPAAKSARKATLESFDKSTYSPFAGWEPVKSVAVRGRKKLTFKITAQHENTKRFRVRIETKAGRSKPSKPVAIKVWRWIPLREFSPYQQTSGTGTGEGSIAGRRYAAWGGFTYSSARSWESRYTPGRNCKMFRGLAGLADTSADGTSGAVTLSADEQPLWTSPVLTPGVAYPFEVALNLPYRMSLAAANTSAPELRAYPLIGNPELLCTGI
ncbi:hypothetical protein [Nocardioides houyundeii]|uniref:hypothetical protein n=1 Tax=Nocardioides houyundeii TaxID=2045452 RepID=UPI0013B3C9D3|nr:hypothetical protein [Nocardioides houyundeii]